MGSCRFIFAFSTSLLITIVLSRMNVEQANAELKKLDQ